MFGSKSSRANEKSRNISPNRFRTGSDGSCHTMITCRCLSDYLFSLMIPDFYDLFVLLFYSIGEKIFGMIISLMGLTSSERVLL